MVFISHASDEQVRLDLQLELLKRRVPPLRHYLAKVLSRLTDRVRLGKQLLQGLDDPVACEHGRHPVGDGAFGGAWFARKPFGQRHDLLLIPWVKGRKP